MAVTEIEVPDGSLLTPLARAEDVYVDAFEVPCSGADLSAVITAFYSQPLMRAERVLLAVAGMPSGAADVAALAAGQTARFAAWDVEARRADELLLRDRSGRTLSWLMAAPGAVRFGSAVVSIGPVVRTLIGPHRLYSRMLLAGAARRL
ncbi:MAG: hypothetical protein AAFY38_09765 [Pseudomonadota bacterium]